jgi:hypothetical protein
VTSARYGVRSIALALRSVYDRPGTSSVLSRRLGITRHCLYDTLVGLHGCGRVHVGRWADGRGQGKVPQPVWYYGNRPDAPPPRANVKFEDSLLRHPPRLTLRRFELVVSAMESRGHSIKELAALSDCDEATIRNLLDLMVSPGFRMVYRTWRRRNGMGGTPTQQWHFGFDKEDEPRPQPLPSSDLTREHYRRKKIRAAIAEAGQAPIELMVPNASIFALANHSATLAASA